VESTIVSFLGDRPLLLRPGGLDAAAIDAALGTTLGRGSEGEGVVAPGMLKSHYAPNLPLRLEATEARAGEAFLGFGGIPDGARQAVAALDLSPSGDLVEAAANLFAHLDRLDRSGAEAIAVAPVPREGLGEAINDRLERGAVGR
jgi:L-threonylcarbamoyladenylate synthase